MGLKLAAQGLRICVFFSLHNALNVRRFQIKMQVSGFTGKIRRSGICKLTFLQARVNGVVTFVFSQDMDL